MVVSSNPDAFTINNATLSSISFKDQDILNPLSANIAKWSNTLKQFVAKFPTHCVSVFDHFVDWRLKGIK